jgi:hypothetical protein
MHGPYTARVEIDRESVVFAEGDLAEGAEIASRFYRDVTVATVEGATRAATFTAALLLAPEQEAEAEVEVLGFVAGKPLGVRFVRVRRDRLGRCVSTLGSRFNKRVFVGV